MAAHVLVFPWPVQGHINCMLHFATGLLGAGLHVTFLHSDHTLPAAGDDNDALAAASPRLRYVSIPDGLPDGHPRNAGAAVRLMESVQTQASAYRSLLANLARDPAGDGNGGGFPPVTCVVADGVMPFAVDVAEELGVPALSFRTASACSFLAYLSMPRLFELGELPFPAGGDLDEPVRSVPGMDSFLRRRDLPGQCRNCTEFQNDPLLEMVIDFTARSRNARALVLNTAASMEEAALDHIARNMRDVFAIGPLHVMSPAPAAALASQWREGDDCLAWLDGQTDRSVVYVSLGSLAVISLEQFTEFLSGLVAAGYPFLWVLRPDMVGESQHSDLQAAVMAAAGDSKARVVGWAPQRDVLRHRAVGCFLTHAGWNSTLEAAVEGVPMVCWPFFVDQQINSRFVDAVWRTGLDMKDVCDAGVVEKMVREAMESDEIRSSAQALSEQLRRDVGDGGSSATEFKRLVAFIEQLSTMARYAASALDDEKTVRFREFERPLWPPLSTGLLGAGLHVTFLHSDHNLRLAGGDDGQLVSPRFPYVSIPDGLPVEQPRERDVGRAVEVMESLRTKASVAYRSLLASLVGDAGAATGGFPPLTCVVADGIMSFAVDVADELDVPAISLRTDSTCAIMAYLSQPRLMDLGEFPFKDGDDLDEPVRGVPGMESFFHRRDLPSQCRDCIDPLLQIAYGFTAHSGSARALVLNTAASMERAALAHIAPQMRDTSSLSGIRASPRHVPPGGSGSQWREDERCLAWLDGQAERSVLYVSLGSIAVISLEQFTEFLLGLVTADYPFLWVLRPDMVVARRSTTTLREAVMAEAGKNKACVVNLVNLRCLIWLSTTAVEWAPQQDVLRHRAVGCFLTHAGWNSTVEAAMEGMPMVCWPFFTNQQMNSRFVCGVWRMGLDMKDVCDAGVVEKMVREAMESGEIRATARALP
uniref:Uncharacterized protein n=1 Tax=Oryza punctata TaxID=4537 RepID=A0A0E0LKT0_ORYPU